MRWRSVAGLGLLLLPALALQGCSSLPPAKDVAAVRLCTSESCDDAAGRASTAQLLQGLNRLLSRNDGAALQLCEADPRSGLCLQDDLGYFVLGGVLPGRGSANTASMSAVRLDEAQQALRLRLSMPLRFLGGEVRCEVHDAVLQVATPGRISLRSSDHGCNWMVVGIMTASFAFEVDAIDLERGRISGWWRHNVRGTGNGSGQGYATMRFPKGLSSGEVQAALQVSAR